MKNEKSPFCQCLYYAANALSRSITKMAEEEFAITGLSPSYAFLIMTVNMKPGVQAGEVSRIMMLRPSTVTRLTEKMEHKGYVERKTEGRATRIYPTERSIELDKKIKRAWLNLFERYTAVLGKEESQKLTAAIYSTAMQLEEE